MEIKNLFGSAYYRRLVLAYVIDEQEPISTVEIENLLNWPKNTIKSNISGLRDIGIEVEHVGSRKTGGYQLQSWGPIEKKWVKKRYDEIIESLETFSTKE